MSEELLPEAHASGGGNRYAYDRRNFLKSAGTAGIGALGLSALGGLAALPAGAQTPQGNSGGPTDEDVLNFALNLEYLEAEFYLRAVTGRGLDDSLKTGTGSRGEVTGGRPVRFKSRAIKQYAEEIAEDERRHVVALRQALGSNAVAEPAIDIDGAFTAAARAAGVIGANQSFDAYANDVNFLLAAFIFEDVGVTAYNGAATLISNKNFLQAAAGILAVEAYHAGNIRNSLYALAVRSPKLFGTVAKISAARGSLGGGKDQGILVNGHANIIPTDENALAFARTTGEVLNIVYLTPGNVSRGGFFPNGVNGRISGAGGSGLAAGGAGTANGNGGSNSGNSNNNNNQNGLLGLLFR